MYKEELLSIFSEVLNREGKLKVAGIHEEDHKPHPFTVSDEHTEYAKEHNEGVLSEDICDELGCKHPDCTLKYDQHESDKTLVLQLTSDITQDDAHEELKKIKLLLRSHAVAKVAFADSEEGYKFI